MIYATVSVLRLSSHVLNEYVMMMIQIWLLVFGGQSSQVSTYLPVSEVHTKVRSLPGHVRALRGVVTMSDDVDVLRVAGVGSVAGVTLLVNSDCPCGVLLLLVDGDCDVARGVVTATSPAGTSSATDSVEFVDS